MNPIYKFELYAFGGQPQIAKPVFGDGLSKDFERESGQQFFRAKLNGKLTFQDADFSLIVGADIDTQFILDLYISYDGGLSYQDYWSGTFWKTDCEFDYDTKTVTVSPSVNDQYSDVMAGLDREYNLIDLLPQIVPVSLDKRPMIQVYVPGQSVIGCFLSGMWWEQSVTPESDESKLTEIGDGKLNFLLNKSFLIAEISGTTSPELPDLFTGTFDGSKFNPLYVGTQDFTNGDFKFSYFFNVGQGGYTLRLTISRNSTTLWEYSETGGTLPDLSLPKIYTLSPVSGSGSSGTVEIYLHEITIYCRYICDVNQISNQVTYELPVDDLVDNNRNYKRVIGYGASNYIYISTLLETTPTKWGIYKPGKYYAQPYNPAIGEFYPIARAGWGRVSVWFTFATFDWVIEQQARASFTLRDAFPLSSVISVLLAQFAPNVTHEGTTDYSSFLYGTNPITGADQTILITPKSNIIYTGYDQPAQQAKITLQNVLEMLRDCFRCYWFIDDFGRFRIEHIKFFMNGGSYDGIPIVGVDLTSERVLRNGKSWAFGRNKFSYEKPNMVSRYEFNWMDNVTQLFDGFPIDIVSRFVNPDNVEKITVSQFTSDVDYMLLNPGEISRDGFALLAAVRSTYAENEPFTQIAPAGPYRLPVDWKNGEYIEIHFTASGTVGVPLSVYFLDASNNPIQPIGSVTLSNSSQSIVYGPVQVPEGAAKLQFYIPSGTAGVQVSAIYGGYSLPYFNFVINSADHFLQNAFVAFAFLYQYYLYDLPAYNYQINGANGYAEGIKKLKNQSLTFPAYTDPDLFKLIKTNLGNGMIKKLSVNLSSRNANATLMYDTE